VKYCVPDLQLYAVAVVLNHLGSEFNADRDFVLFPIALVRVLQQQAGLADAWS
jgi:hypothetical protein